MGNEAEMEGQAYRRYGPVGSSSKKGSKLRIVCPFIIGNATRTRIVRLSCIGGDRALCNNGSFYGFASSSFLYVEAACKPPFLRTVTVIIINIKRIWRCYWTIIIG